MNRAQLLQHFDTLAETPDAVAKLRAFVLDLAVRGQLVPQTSKLDKDADWQKFCGELDEHESPSLFEVPDAWRWVALDEIAESCGQKKPDKRFTYIDVGAIDNVRGVIMPDLQILEADEAPSRARKLIRANSIIYSTVRPNLRNIAIIEKDFDPPAIVSTAFAVLHPKPFLNSRYLFLWLRSAPFQADVAAKMKGVAYPAISDSELWQCPIPIPPPEEQRRIVAKVEELLALCDELEARQTAAREHRTRLVRSALDHLTTAQTEPEFRQHAAFLLQHSNLVLDSVSTIRQAILSLAVQGRLVSQSSKDKSASLLVEDLIKARGKLTKGRKSQGVEPASEDACEVPHQIPAGWEAVRLGEIADIGTGSTPSSTNPEYYEGGTIPWITSGATSQAVIESAETCVTEKAVEDFRLRLYEPSTIIIALYGQGKTRGQVSRLRIKATVNQACATIMFPEEYESVGDYLMLVLRQQYLSLREQAAGGAQPNLNGSKIKNIILPLPPLAEQQRIVAKVDGLMRWCDALESRLTAAQTTAAHLLDATLHQILSN
jgi:type I restriction enzyme S subunit